ncbi:MAG TPA: flippase [Terriglobia bacterium]|nr:flippase [Terriglobia bacterium]
MDSHNKYLQEEVVGQTVVADISPPALEPSAGPMPRPFPDPAFSERKKDVRRLAAGASIALAGKLIGRGVRLVGDVVLAHILGPATFGLYAIGWTLARIATVLAPLGLDAGVIRFASPYRNQDLARFKGAVTQSLQYSTLSGLLLGIAFYLLTPWLALSVFHQATLIAVFRCFAFGFPLMTCLKVASAATRVSQRMKFSAYAEEIGQPAAALALILVFYLFGYRLGGALAAFVLSFGFASILAIYYIGKLFPEIISKAIRPVFAGKHLLSFSLPASVSVMFGILLIWVDRLFVGYYRPAAEVGIYHAASQLSIALAVILSAFGAIVTPMIAELYHRGKESRLEELFRVSTKWSLYLSIPPFLVMCFVPQQAVAVIFGNAYIAGWAVLPILGAGQLLNSGTGPVGALLVMTGHQNQLSVLSGAMFLANIGCAVLLVPRFGIWGAALGTAATVGLLCLISIFMAKAYLKLWPYDRRYSKGLVATAAAAAALFFFRQFQVTSPFLALTGAVVVSVLVFVAVLSLLGLDVEDREFLRLIFARLLRQTGI